MHSREEKLEAFGRLLDVLDRLRKECPWDKKQTNESLRPNTIEETFELADALIKDDMANIREELGDVIMHVIFYALIGQERGDFDIADVCDKEAEKLIHDAKLLDEAGCFSIVLEKIPAALAAKVTQAVSCPVIGIGAGNQCDGQVLVLHDMLGLNQGFKPKFLRHFAHMADEVKSAVGEYISGVKDSSFPSAEESY